MFGKKLINGFRKENKLLSFADHLKDNNSFILIFYQKKILIKTNLFIYFLR